MSDIKVTVVLPIYNVESYLDRCINSILHQSLPDFELICINDASTDGSLQIVKNAEVDHRIKVIDFPENKGVGAARNAGIRAAQGETICFCDPDDFLPQDSLKSRYEIYARHKCVVKAQGIDMTPEGRVTRIVSYPSTLTNTAFVPQGDCTFIDLFDYHQAWLFPTQWLRDNKIEYKEGMKNAQDLYFLAKSFFYMDKLICANTPGYCLVHRQESATNRKCSFEYYRNILRCAEIFYEESIAKNKILYGDYYFNIRLVHTISKIVENSTRDMMDEEEFLKVIEYGMYLFKKFNVFLRYKNPEFLQLFPGIHLLVCLTSVTKGSISYRVYKAQKAMGKFQTMGNLCA